MKNYQSYSVSDFLEDEDFRCWVLDPTPESSDFWHDYLHGHPEQASNIQEAKTLLQAIELQFGESQHLSDETVENEVRDMLDLMPGPVEKRNWLLAVYWGRVAAAVLLIAGLIGWYRFQEVPAMESRRYKVADLTDRKTEVVRNGEHGPKAVFLADGSVVMLEPGSSIRYARAFDGATRAVELDGEAFFDVTKDKSRPFIVYARETVTRVVGTSFRIKAFDKDDDVVVAVKTGNVAVYAQKDFKDGAENEDSGVSLVPNEQVVFNRKEERIQKEAVQNVAAIASRPDLQEQTFDDTPLSEVLSRLGHSYNIAIVFQEKAMSSCKITTQFKEEGLRQRLDIICDAIDAGYRVQDGKVIISGAGCTVQ